MSATISTLLPPLTMNHSFIGEFIDAEPGCCALGILEERKRRRGVIAIRPSEPIPAEATQHGFDLGHAMVGTSKYQIIMLAFVFRDFKTYHALINPNNLIVRAALTRMVEDEDYWFLVLNPGGHVVVFSASSRDCAGLKSNMPMIKEATTTPTQYRQSLTRTGKLELQGERLEWVCRDNVDYLDLATDRITMNPRQG